MYFHVVLKIVFSGGSMATIGEKRHAQVFVYRIWMTD